MVISMMTIEQILAMDEKQIFDRKSIQIKPSDLSATICAFANADGGTIAIGISDKHKRIEGIDYHTEQLNEILRTPIDFCVPSVPVSVEFVECINSDGKKDHVLLMHIEASPLFHANQADEAYIRVGDKSKKLDFNDRLMLMYAKGVRYYEDEPVADASIADLDMDFIGQYCTKIGYGKTPEQYVRENKKFVTIKNGKEQVSVAAVLLFGKKPQLFFPRAFIRFIRYDGIEPLVGKDMNVVKDVIFEGRILEQVEKAVAFIQNQMKERTYLGNNGVFITEEEYSKFVRTELVVNAVAHRDYGIKGTDIQIKMFDNRLEVDSPGVFPGMVKKENIRYTHFSRNPKIASFLKDYAYVKEYGEGVDRMCNELEAIGLPCPAYDNSSFILKTTVMSASAWPSKSGVKNIFADSQSELPIGGENLADSQAELPIGGEKLADSHSELPIGGEKLADSQSELPIGEEKSADCGMKSNINIAKTIKLSATSFDELLNDRSYSEKINSSLRLIYQHVDDNQIFDSNYIVKILKCSERTARNLVNKLKEMGVLVVVTGNGKGNYRFKYKDEL